LSVIQLLLFGLLTAIQIKKYKMFILTVLTNKQLTHPYLIWVYWVLYQPNQTVVEAHLGFRPDTGGGLRSRLTVSQVAFPDSTQMNGKQEKEVDDSRVVIKSCASACLNFQAPKTQDDGEMKELASLVVPRCSAQLLRLQVGDRICTDS
jgi:hypothetical protein